MMFEKRELPQTATLGERLRQVRSDAGLSLEDVAKETSVQAKYLAAIEAGQYRQLPGPVYARNFVKRYAQVLGVSEGQAMDLFDREYHIITSGKVDRHLPSERVSTEHHWLRRHARLISAAAAVIIVLGYLGLQVEHLIIPPSLSITRPAGDVSTTDRQYVVSGITDVTASVSINGQPASTDQHGNFSERIDLAPGLNTLTIVAQKKHSRPRTVIRNILVTEAPVFTSPT